jgi:hypothetical protein
MHDALDARAGGPAARPRGRDEPGEMGDAVVKFQPPVAVLPRELRHARVLGKDGDVVATEQAAQDGRDGAAVRHRDDGALGICPQEACEAVIEPGTKAGVERGLDWRGLPRVIPGGEGAGLAQRQLVPVGELGLLKPFV